MDLPVELQPLFRTSVVSDDVSWVMDSAETSMQHGNTAAKSKANLNAHEREKERRDMAASEVADAGAAAAGALVITTIAKKYQNSD